MKLFRIVKRAELSSGNALMIRLAAIVLALVTTGIFILSLGHNPLTVYGSMLRGTFGSAYRVKEAIHTTIPLVVTSLGIAVAFRMKFWNIGGEGQILMGSYGAALVAFQLQTLPKPLLLILMALSGMVFGGLWSLIPAFFKAHFRTNETLFTLMMNYIAYKWVMYLQYGPWKDPNASGFPKIADFTDNAILPKLLGVHIGWLIALILVVVIHIFINRTKKGYEISVIGESENTARYAGMNVKKVILIAVFFSGAIIGLSGMIQTSAINKTLDIVVTNNVGYTAIITAWLAQLSAPVIVIVSFLFAVLVQGGSYIQAAFQIPQAAAQIIQGMILFFVLGCEFFIQYRLVPYVKSTTGIVKEGK